MKELNQLGEFKETKENFFKAQKSLLLLASNISLQDDDSTILFLCLGNQCKIYLKTLVDLNICDLRYQVAHYSDCKLFHCEINLNELASKYYIIRIYLKKPFYLLKIKKKDLVPEYKQIQ